MGPSEVSLDAWTTSAHVVCALFLHFDASTPVDSTRAHVAHEALHLVARASIDAWLSWRTRAFEVALVENSTAGSRGACWAALVGWRTWLTWSARNGCRGRSWAGAPGARGV